MVINWSPVGPEMKVETLSESLTGYMAVFETILSLCFTTMDKTKCLLEKKPGRPRAREEIQVDQKRNFKNILLKVLQITGNTNIYSRNNLSNSFIQLIWKLLIM